MFQRTSRRTGGATTPASGSVTNAQLADMNAGTTKGRTIDGGAGTPVDLSGAEQAENLRYATVQAISISGATNNQSINDDATVLRITPSGRVSLTGITGGVLGRKLIIENIAGSGNTLILESLDAGSTAANQFRTPVGRPFVLGFRESVEARWEGDWRVLERATAPDTLDIVRLNIAVPFMVYISCASGGSAGTADDVTIWNAAAPFALRILDAQLRVSTAVGGSSAALRTASGGGGSVVLPDPGSATQTFSTATTGVLEDLATATATVASGGSLFLRRSDRSVVGELMLTCIRT